jgi:asparagine synthase (glutamine-hydrolysing)
MVDALRHESFYVAGTWIEEGLGIYAGWVARKGSFSDDMPFSNERDDSVLIFSGEEFPDPGTTQRLKSHGHTLDGKGASYLIHLYEEDRDFPASLNGIFHGLVVDRKTGAVTLFNDRYGMDKLVIYESKDAFYFAAEAKCILAVCPDSRRLDAKSLGEFISCGCVLEDRTLFKGVHALPPGSAWTFRNGALDARRTYFSPRAWVDQEPVDAEGYYRELRKVFSRNLPRYFNGHERVGMSVTGGLDTRMILAWHKTAPQSLPCYTFGGSIRPCRDVVIGRKVAQIGMQPHQVIAVGGEFLASFPRYAERAVYLSDGCVDVSRTPDLYVNERAREIAPVRVTGNYGGEVLRALRAFKPVEPPAGLFVPEVVSQARAAKTTYDAAVQTHPVAFSAFRQAPWHHRGLFGLEQTQVSMRSPFLDNDVVRTAFRAPHSALEGDDACLRLIAEGDSALSSIRTDRGRMANDGSWWSALVCGYQEFTFKAEYACDYGMPQWAARIDHLVSPLHLERLFLGRHKFYHFRVWYRDVLGGYLREMLLHPRALARPYLERRAADEIVRSHVGGKRNHTTEIHKLLTLELVHRLFLDA